MSLLQNSNAISAGGYTIDNSIRLRSSATANLTRTPSSTTNRRTYTWSGWVKRGALPASRMVLFVGDDGTVYTYVGFNSSHQLQFYHVPNTSGTEYGYNTSAVFRDPSAWYHIVLAVDTTQATAGNRVKIYVNGVQQTISLYTAYGDIPQNTDTFINTNNGHTSYGWNRGSSPFDGYGSDVNFIDGSAKTPSDFGETDTTTGVWKPKAYTGTYGTNGFYLKFSDIATTSGSNAGLGKDFSGNGNYWTTNNISVTSGTTYDAMIDSPTNATSGTRPVGNYAVLNPVAGQGNGTYSDGNLAYINGTSATWKSGVGSLGVSSGKYYFEYTITSVSSSNYFYLGVAGSTYNGFASYLGRTSDSWAFQWNGASSNKMNNDTTTTVNTAGSISVNDVIQVAIDLGTGSIWWGRNNTWVQGDPSAGTGASYTNLSGTILPGFAIYSNGGDKIAANFGQRPFAYTPPTGYKALCTTNLPDSTIVKGNSYMDATTYAGASATQSVTNAGSFKPDLVWIKNRGSGSNYHVLTDSVRGIQKELYSNATSAEATPSSSGGVSAFNSNGFTLNSSNNDYNGAYNYVGWQWQAGQGSTSSNTSGTITSTVSVNTTAGFSIVTYTGTGANATVGHGLGVAPKLIIAKTRSLAAKSWPVYHVSNGAGGYTVLNSTAAYAADTNMWQNTTPTSNVFSIGTDSWNNGSTGTYVAYCWAEIAGFSKFGSYTGNGSTDGPMIFTGFQPKYILIKSAATANSWRIVDSVRNPYNTANSALWANESTAEATGSTHAIDILSNGFKIRNTTSETNNSGTTLIYAAFASNPFKNSLAF